MSKGLLVKINLIFILFTLITGCAISNSRSQEARMKLEIQCLKSQVDSCITLANTYGGDNGLAPDNVKAAIYYQRACDLDDADSCQILGWYTESGTGVEKNIIKSNTLYLKACNLGNAYGCNNLGYELLHSGNSKEGVKYLLKACQQLFLGRACRSLGYAYYNGLNVNLDYKLAYKYNAYGCDVLEDGGSCLNTALAYDNARGKKHNNKKAQEYFLIACNLGNDDACDFIDK
jgi:TPR repeat protein